MGKWKLMGENRNTVGLCHQVIFMGGLQAVQINLCGLGSGNKTCSLPQGCTKNLNKSLKSFFFKKGSNGTCSSGSNGNRSGSGRSSNSSGSSEVNVNVHVNIYIYSIIYNYINIEVNLHAHVFVNVNALCHFDLLCIQTSHHCFFFVSFVEHHSCYLGLCHVLSLQSRS